MVWQLVVMAALTAATSVFAGDTVWKKEDKLREDLLKNYSKHSLPHRTVNGTTTAYFGFQVMAVWFEEGKEILNVNAWSRMVWHDPHLVWDTKQYDGINVLHVHYQTIWKPEIYLYNNADLSSVNHFSGTKALVYSTGEVLWVPPSLFKALCPLDYTYWPYETQTCDLFFGAWTYNGWQVDLQLYHNQSSVLAGNNKLSRSWMMVSGKIQKHVIQYKDMPPYSLLQVSLVLTRTSPSFTSTVVLPACVISVLTLVQFVLPLREPRRLTLGCMSLLLTLLLLLYLATIIPPTATSLPIIVKFYGQTLVVVVVSVCVSASLLRLTDSRHPASTAPPPTLLKTILTGPLGTILFLQRYTDKVGLSGGGGEDGEVLEEARPASYLHEWILVAAAVDRLAALTFVATFVITLIAYVSRV
ncbi:Neuronal acetylcholine receptor subunit alpha-6-like 4 [Homarus americanus]|uniref:Neuronal acetylcholine receptor subunit alpha-6-like 4 n=2 Tax=Homarus americanus TaxID=6706 RepID=A0A8J5JK81_HOMAM|nr:Neuronal acetylcholine receptor subunit alpha-6-like 4 [Homarus americanus]